MAIDDAANDSNSRHQLESTCCQLQIHFDVSHTASLHARSLPRCSTQLLTRLLLCRRCVRLAGWYGVIFVRKGHYRGGVFKFVLLIPTAYPDEGPKVHFLSEVREKGPKAAARELHRSIASVCGVVKRTLEC